MPRFSDRRIADPALPPELLSRRCHGSLDAITDSERRALRPIGTTAQEVAARTGVLLAELLVLPSVRIFQGIRQVDSCGEPRIAHAISAGRRVVLIESVAWPPGRYSAMATGRIHCDGAYIGQSIRPLVAAVAAWRRALRRDHEVSALVVVYPAAEGELTLPAGSEPDVAWASAADAVEGIRARLPRPPEAVSVRAIAALVAATEECA